MFLGLRCAQDDASDITAALSPVLRSHRFLDAEAFTARLDNDQALKRRRGAQTEALTGRGIEQEVIIKFCRFHSLQVWVLGLDEKG